MDTTLTLLIVDDIFINRLLIKEIVSSLSANIIEAQNGKDAIDILMKQEVDIVLMDIEMPIMNGLETTRFIRKEFPSPKKFIPIIALTAHNPITFFNDYKDVGFNQLMTKPYSSKKLLSIINEVLV